MSDILVNWVNTGKNWFKSFRPNKGYVINDE